MKKYISLLAVVASMSLASCSNFLDVKPEGNVTTDAAFESDQQSIDQIDALYFYLGGYGDDLFGRSLFYEQAAAGDYVWGRNRSFPTLASMDYTGDESPLRNDFTDLYELMAKSNFVVKGLLDKGVNNLSAIERRSLGEAYFMRAFAHFWVAHRYGTAELGVPFIRYEEVGSDNMYQIPPQQKSVCDNYRMIVEDMEAAMTFLPKLSDYGDADLGRAHKAAALGYIAKTYAYWATWENSKYDEVIKAVDRLQSEFGREITPDLETIYSDNIADFYNSEYLWSIPGNGGALGGGTQFVGVCVVNKAWGIYNGWGYGKPSNDIYEEMAKDNQNGVKNKRLARSILEYGDEFPFWGQEGFLFYDAMDNESGFMVNKWTEPFKHKDADVAGYVNTNGDYPTARVNFHLLRFAELRLLRAEAYLLGPTKNAGKAAEDINKVRTRSGLTELNGAATTADLYHEMRCELAFEFTDHLFDLKRWHKCGDATLKALCAKELNNYPKVRHHADRFDPTSSYTIGDYNGGYAPKTAYDDHKIVYPYPSKVIENSNGALKQNAGY